MNKLYLGVAFVLSLIFLFGWTTENGKLNLNISDVAIPDATKAQKNWFATATGTGDCLTWETACTFRTAVSKCSDSVQDVLWLSPEDHDTNNGTDGTGTEISASNVELNGMGELHQFGSRLYNSHATASKVLVVTGGRCGIHNVRFTQDGQTDVDVIYLDAQGNRTNLQFVEFKSATGATADVGALLSGDFGYFYHVHFRGMKDAGLRTDDASSDEFISVFFANNGKGIDLTDTDDGPFKFDNAVFRNCTSAIEIAAGVADIVFYNPKFLDCTENIGSTGDYNELHISNPAVGHYDISLYPTNAGTVVTGGAASYAQGNLTQIIPASTITTPFYIDGINVQAASATDICKLEFFYGEASGSAESLGTFEFVSDRKTGINLGNLKAEAFAANSYIGVKLATASGGADTVTITLSYRAMR